MFDFPGFEPKTLSDEALMKHAEDLTKKIYWATAFSSGNGVEQLTRLLDIVETERLERMFMENWDQSSAYLSATIESDPGFRDQPSENKPSEKKENNNRRRTQRYLIPVVTRNPVIPTSQPPTEAEKSK